MKGDNLHSLLMLTLDGGEWSASRPGWISPGVSTPTPYPLNKGMGGIQKKSGRFGEETHLSLRGFKLRFLSAP